MPTHWSPDRDHPVVHRGPVDDCPKCYPCGSCKGAGGDYNGPCWDCRGTGLSA